MTYTEPPDMTLWDIVGCGVHIYLLPSFGGGVGVFFFFLYFIIFYSFYMRRGLLDLGLLGL